MGIFLKDFSSLLMICWELRYGKAKLLFTDTNFFLKTHFYKIYVSFPLVIEEHHQNKVNYKLKTKIPYNQSIKPFKALIRFMLSKIYFDRFSFGLGSILHKNCSSGWLQVHQSQILKICFGLNTDFRYGFGSTPRRESLNIKITGKLSY